MYLSTDLYKYLIMKTKFRNLGIALILSVVAIGVDATEIKRSLELASEPKMEIENWIKRNKNQKRNFYGNT